MNSPNADEQDHTPLDAVALSDLKTRQQSGELTTCPRCGCDTMNPVLYHNAMSRFADAYVCPTCGNAEAMEWMVGVIEPLAHWACFAENAPGDLGEST
jgi:DNA-directed RNA polymerase subunit M/transcription elongation factor TFIIS